MEEKKTIIEETSEALIRMIDETIATLRTQREALEKSKEFIGAIAKEMDKHYKIVPIVPTNDEEPKKAVINTASGTKLEPITFSKVNKLKEEGTKEQNKVEEFEALKNEMLLWVRDFADKFGTPYIRKVLDEIKVAKASEVKTKADCNYIINRLKDYVHNGGE